jgi:multiple sugar transport system permease protein
MASAFTATAGFAASAKRRNRAAVLPEILAAWTLAGPAIAAMWLLLLGPALAVIALSLTDWTFGAPTIRSGALEN